MNNKYYFVGEYCHIVLPCGSETIIDKKHFDKVNSYPNTWKLFDKKKGYVSQRTRNGKGGHTYTALHRLIKDFPPNDVHHKDENKLNNTEGNLKEKCHTEHAREHSQNIAIELEINGIKKCLLDWARHFGIPYSTVYWRYKRGLSINEIFSYSRAKYRRR